MNVDMIIFVLYIILGVVGTALCFNDFGAGVACLGLALTGSCSIGPKVFGATPSSISGNWDFETAKASEWGKRS